MQFEWDEEKNRRNIEKHGIDFSDAADIFNHPLLTMLDDRYDYEENRWVSIGWIHTIVGVVVYTERTEDVVRIISARKATRREVQCYEQVLQN